VIAWESLTVGLGAAVVLYSVLVAVLFLCGRRAEAGAAAIFVPGCLVLFGRLLRDRRVPRREKLLLGAVAGYLAVPIDLVPDFIPIAGQLDDVVLVLVVLRRLLRKVGSAIVQAHWPGPPTSLRLLLRLAGYGPAREPRLLGGGGV
jgi:hypothetical protein